MKKTIEIIIYPIVSISPWQSAHTSRMCCCCSSSSSSLSLSSSSSSAPSPSPSPPVPTWCPRSDRENTRVVRRNRKRAGIAQWVERPIEKPGAILTRVRVPRCDVQGIFLPDSFQCRLSHGVRTAPVCNRMHQQLCAHHCLAIPLFGLTKILHTPIGMGSAALAAAVPPYPSGATRISLKGQ